MAIIIEVLQLQWMYFEDKEVNWELGRTQAECFISKCLETNYFIQGDAILWNSSSIKMVRENIVAHRNESLQPARTF